MKRGAPRSLVGRLALWAAGLVAVSVPVFWVLFATAVDTVSRDIVDTRILAFADQVRGYWASLEADPNGGDADRPTPGLGGPDVEWIYQISRAGRTVERSELLALYGAALPRRVADPAPAFAIAEVAIPLGTFRVAERVVDEIPPFPARDGTAWPVRVHYLVGLTIERYQSYVAEHAERLRGLALLAAVPISLVILGMLAFIVLALRRDLGNVTAALRRYEVGETETIDGRFPAELQGLVDRVNGLLAQNARLVGRTRKYVGKIAHDINHPLAIMKNALAKGGDADLLGRQIERMAGLGDRYSSLARAIGPEGKAGRRTNVAEMLADVAEGFAILYRRRPIAIETACDPELTAPFPRHDLEAMVSNLVSNAYKFADARVRLGGRFEAEALVLSVEDDGPGVPAERRETVLGWGERLDEAPPGTGFGLSIVRDIAELYQGEVRLGDSADLGGLLAEIRLPLDPVREAAEAAPTTLAPPHSDG